MGQWIWNNVLRLLLYTCIGDRRLSYIWTHAGLLFGGSWLFKTIWEFSENRGGFFKWGAGFSSVYCGIWNARGYIQWGSSIRGVLYTLPITGQYLAQIS